jgi:hypothetical protein
MEGKKPFFEDVQHFKYILIITLNDVYDLMDTKIFNSLYDNFVSNCTNIMFCYQTAFHSIYVSK